MAAGAAEDPLAVARKHLADKNPKAAYEVLAPLQGERAGDPGYDYLLGISALDAGRLTEAVFALERVLAVQPDNAQARAEIARAYFLLGERDAAKGEFQSVTEANVPAEARATVRQYLEAIARAESVEGTRFRAYMDVTVGYDSNVNSSPGENQVAVPAFGGAIFTLDPRNVEEDDMFGSFGAGVSVSHRLDSTWSLFAGLNLNQRINSSAGEFDTGGWDFNAGVAARFGKNAYSLAYQTSDLYVDYDRYRDINGVVLQWQHDIDPSTQISAFGQYATLRYPGQDIRDADRSVFGLALAHAYAARFNPVVFGSVYVGNEDETEGGVPQLGHRVLGWRVGGEITVRSDLKAFGGFSYEDREYGSEPAGSLFFPLTREDKQYDVRVGMTYEPMRFWKVIPQYTYTRSDSNIAVNDFDRHVLAVTVRREFE